MSRLLTTTLLIMLIPLAPMAKHISGGEMGYEYLGPGAAAGTGRYAVTLRLYRECNAPPGAIQLEPTANIAIIRRGGPGIFLNYVVSMSRRERTELTKPDPCLSNQPKVCFEIGLYRFETELPIVSMGYDIVYQQCCRINNLSNIVNTPEPNEPGYRYIATIPGSLDHPLGPTNSSPVFNGGDTVLVCRDRLFQYDFSARDVDGDSLAYEFAYAYKNSPSFISPNENLAYSAGYGFSEPMGPKVKLDRGTGLMSGTAQGVGIYVVTVEVLEFRNQKLINRHRKDLQIRVGDCSSASVELDPSYIDCKGSGLTFQNNTSDPLIKTYSWDFGVTDATDDTSALERPAFTFPDTGVYRVRLIINRNLPCTDTGYTYAKIFPGFKGGFTVDDGCKGIPLPFKDTSRAAHGRVDSWEWSFGYPLANPATSNLRKPSHSYTENGMYDVRLIVGSDKGCKDTVHRMVNVLGKPSLRVTPDLSICRGDSAPLRAEGNGVFSWAPSTGLSDTDVADPVASPTVKTRYYVTLSNGPGCENRDSVEVDVRAAPTLDAGRDTTVCLTDTLRLRPASDGDRFEWQPSATLDDPASKNPLARPLGTTVYVVTARLGAMDGCLSKDSVVVTTVPYPNVTISADTTVCLGDSILLKAIGGVDYIWSPADGLSDSTSAEPVARPLKSTLYRVAVRGNAGCPKQAFDSVLVRVAPRIVADAGRDTSIAVGQSLRLRGSGGGFYLWSPSTGLSDPNIADPVVNILRDQTYVLKVTGLLGCSDTDTLNIRVFQTEPDIFVPTAFTPNGDGLNDLLTPIPVGIREFQSFRIYNRWGQLVFATSEAGRGWDGRHKGSNEPNGSFAWQVRGVSVTGRIIEKRGTTTLIR